MSEAPPVVDVGLFPLPAPAAYVDMGGRPALGVRVILDRPAATRLEVGRAPA